MARYAGNGPSRRPAAETFDYLATFSNAVDWDPGVLVRRAARSGPGPRRAPGSGWWCRSWGGACR